MLLFKRILIIFFLIIPISNSSAAMVTEVDSDQAYSFLDGAGATLGLNGIAFNPDGTKMFVSAGNGSSSPHGAGDGDDFINEYNLPTPFDISTAVYAGNSARCDLTGTIRGGIGDMVFSSDGLKIFTVTRGTNGSNRDLVYRYDLTAPYDVSTCVYVAKVNPDTTAIQDGWRYGSLSINNG